MAHPDPEVRKIARKIYKEYRDEFERVERFCGANRQLAIEIREMAGVPAPVEAQQI